MRIAREKGLVKLKLINPRVYAKDGQVDDYQFGGGAGMVMKPEAISAALENTRSSHAQIIVFTPKGKQLDQNIVKELSNKKHLILICGRYKGIDNRINEKYKPLELSLGDYILSGGENAASVLIESLTRLLPGALGNLDSANSDSFEDSLLEAPIFTRPAVFKNISVPEILLGGNHRLISDWRRKNALSITLEQRPDILAKGTFKVNDLELLLEVINEKRS
jgi:tRNA (guanine37-N1)-methyltransferase